MANANDEVKRLKGRMARLELVTEALGLRVEDLEREIVLRQVQVKISDAVNRALLGGGGGVPGMHPPGDGLPPGRVLSDGQGGG
jgi:hypothetical protein